MGKEIFQNAMNNAYIDAEPLDVLEFELSQRNTIRRKTGYLASKRLSGALIWLVNNSLYRLIALKFIWAFRFHGRVKSIFERVMTKVS